MIIYENESFEGLILSLIEKSYFISDTSMYRNTSYEGCLPSFRWNPYLKRGDLKKKQDKE